MARIFKVLVIVLFCCIRTNVAFSKPQPLNIEGLWLGTLNNELTVIFKINQNSGILTVTIDCPENGKKDSPADKVNFTNGNLYLQGKGAKSSFVFEGKIKKDGSAMTGVWKQSGLELPLVIKRVSDAEIRRIWDEKSSAKVFTPNMLKKDLDFLFKTIEEVHPDMYAYTSRAEFSKLRDQLYRQISQPMTRLEFYKAVAPVVASLKNGHTFLIPPDKMFAEYLLKDGRIFPLVFHWNGTNIILKSCVNPLDMPVGGEVLTIENQDAAKFLIHLARYFPAENRNYNLGLLERGNTFAMFLWLDGSNNKSLALRIKTINGQVKEYDVKPLSQKEIEIETQTNKTKYESMSSSAEKGSDYSYRYIPEYNAGLIEFNSFNDLKKFKIFLDETFKKIKEQNISGLIIDIRNNPGGNSSLGDELLKYLTDKPFLQFEKAELKFSNQTCKRFGWGKNKGEKTRIGSIKSFDCQFVQPGDNPLRFSGQTFILTGAQTASSAVSFAAAAKHFHIGVLIGQETTDTPVNYGEIFDSKFPNSGLSFAVACKRFVCAGGKPDGRGVIPDFEIKQKSEDIANGVDTVMQFTLNLIKDPNSPLKK